MVGETASIRVLEHKTRPRKKYHEMDIQIACLKEMQKLLKKSMSCRCASLDACGRILLSQRANRGCTLSAFLLSNALVRIRHKTIAVWQSGYWVRSRSHQRAQQLFRH